MLNWKVLSIRTLNETSLFIPKRWLYNGFFVMLILVLDKIVVYVDKKADIEFDIEGKNIEFNWNKHL